MDESARRKPISSSSSSLMDESARRKPMSSFSSLMDESARRKPISSSSSLMDGSARREPMPSSLSSAASADPITTRNGKALVKKNDVGQNTDGFIQTSRENLKIPRPNSLALAAANVDDFKHQISGRNHQYLKKPSTEMDVDKSADDFINRFRQNLKIERKESLDNYKGMLDRGA